MDRLRNQVSGLWNTFKSVPQVVQGYVRDRLDHLPRNYEKVFNMRSQIRNEDILKLRKEYDNKITTFCATLEWIYETLTNFGIQMQELDDPSNAGAVHYLVQSGHELFGHLADLICFVCNGSLSIHSSYDASQTIKLYCKILLVLLSVRYELRWVASLLLKRFAESTHACGEVLSQVKGSVVLLDYQIEIFLNKPFMPAYDSQLHTLDDDFIVDMIQCLDMYKEEMDVSLLSLVTTLRARLAPLVPDQGGRCHPPVPTIDLKSLDPNIRMWRSLF